jgi:uncharacterized protein YkuJ
MYMQGVSFEQSGQVVEAIRYYKRAMQLVPDIEKKVYSPKPKGIFHSFSYICFVSMSIYSVLVIFLLSLNI